MAKSGLTERKMQNKKFKKTEEAIFLAYYKFRDYPNAKILARRAKISRSTLYRHHKSPQFISSNYEEYLLKIFSRKMKHLLSKENIPIETTIFRMLIFIYGHREIINVLFKEGRKDLIKKMLNRIEEQLIIIKKYPRCTKKFYHVFKNEVLGVIEEWEEKGFAINEIDVALNDIIYLINTSPKRLARFLEDS